MPSLPRFLPLILALILPFVAQAQECTHYASPSGPSIAQFWGQAYPGAVLCLRDGEYTGAENMLMPPPGLSGTSDAPITVRALNDGGAVINGSYTHYTFYLEGLGHWVFQGFDVRDSGFSVVYFQGSAHHITVKRVCAYNANVLPRPGGRMNEHVWIVYGPDHLLEDICGLGWGRNVYVDGYNARMVVRRAWMKWEAGWDDAWAGTGAPSYQLDYSLGSNWGHDTIYENLIAVYSSEKTGRTGASNGSGGWFTRAGLRLSGPQDQPGHQGNLFAGHLIYGYDDAGEPLRGGGNGSWVGNRWTPNRAQDLFIDGRSQPQAATLGWGCDWYPSEGNYGIGDCGRAPLDRVTLLQTSGQAPYDITPHPSRTNIQTCTEVGSCPNLFTGQGGSGPGARLCGRYVNGTYTQEPLWPWPMDSRIKTALVRAGSRPLVGEAGPGYEAGTVTSEVVARYGPIPPTCQGGPVIVEPPLPAPYNLRAKVREG